jgi:Cof subfamily protein (haloacid dehalogenase superfamily)
MGKYKAIALDLDGTLMATDKSLPEANREAVWKAIDKGVAVILASGRPLFGVLPVAEKLEMKERGGYVLAYNGGNIWDCKNEKMLYSKTVPQECIPVLCEVAKKYDVAALTYYNNLVISERDQDEYVLKEAFCNGAQTMHVDDLPSFVNYPEAKVLLVGPHEKLLPAKDELDKLYADELTMMFSMDYFLEAVPKNVGKDASLDELLRQLHIDRSELIACGDGMNDIDMIKYAGLGIAMENAYPPVKEAADIMAPSNDDCGVAYIIEKYFEI